MCRAVEFDKADERLAAGWHVALSELNPQDSPQRRRHTRDIKAYSEAITPNSEHDSKTAPNQYSAIRTKFPRSLG